MSGFPPPPSSSTSDAVGAFVERMGGSRPIRKVLIANNGMAAAKFLLSMRRWTYLALGDQSAISFVAMATPEDLAANAEFIRAADVFIEVSPRDPPKIVFLL